MNYTLNEGTRMFSISMLVVLTLFTERQDRWISKIAYLDGNIHTVEPYIKI